MRIEVDFRRKFIVFSLIIGLLVIGFAGVYAYDVGEFGHDPEDIDWTKRILSNVYIKSSAGIGTSNLSAKLNINGTGYAGIIAENSVSGRKFSFYSSDYGNLVIGDQTANAARITINGSTGNVGMGIASSGKKLGVAGTVGANGIVSTGSLNSSQVCLNGDCRTNWSSIFSVATSIGSCQAVASSCTSCSDTINCGSDWDICAITDSYFRWYDNTSDHHHDYWRCRVYRSGGMWYVYALYGNGGGGGTVGYMYCTATCARFT